MNTLKDRLATAHSRLKDIFWGIIVSICVGRCAHYMHDSGPMDSRPQCVLAKGSRSCRAASFHVLSPEHEMNRRPVSARWRDTSMVEADQPRIHEAYQAEAKLTIPYPYCGFLH